MDAELSHFERRGTVTNTVKDPASAGWPSISYEETAWNTEVAPAQSRRQRFLARGPYLSAVTPLMAEKQPMVSGRLAALVEEATIETVRFDRDLGVYAAPFVAWLWRSESAADNFAARAGRLTHASRSI